MDASKEVVDRREAAKNRKNTEISRASRHDATTTKKFTSPVVSYAQAARETLPKGAIPPACNLPTDALQNLFAFPLQRQ